MIALHHSMLGTGKLKPPAYWGLYFEAEENNCSVSMTGSRVNLLYSLDGLNWATFDGSSGAQVINLAKVGDRVYFRDSDISSGYYWSGDQRFILTGHVGAHGNLLSLVSGATSSSINPLGYYLFSDCATLTSAPDIPVSDIGNEYLMETMQGIFRNCTALRRAATMPQKITTHSRGVMANMYAGCTALEEAPTSIDISGSSRDALKGVYSQCTALRRAPILLAQSFVRGAYDNMFYGCTNLQFVETHQTAWTGVVSGYQREMNDSWLYGVAATGVFRCPRALGTDATIERGPSRCPEGWTVVNID